MQADYGINTPFTVTKINVAAQAFAGSTAEAYIVKYNGEWSDYMDVADSEADEDAYGAITIATDPTTVEWFDVELFDPYEVPAGQKFLASLVVPIGDFNVNPAGSFIPWTNVDGATETRPSWFGGEYGSDCTIDGTPNYMNPLSVPDFADNGVYLTKITGYASDMGTVELGGNALKAYPNPATNEVNISLKDSKIADVTIADVTGRTIPARFTADGKVDISRLSAGVYFLRVKDNKDVTRIQKIIKK